MRLLLVLLCGAVALCGACQSAQPKESAPPASTAADSASSSATLTVKGLACPLCAHNLDKQLLRVAGVRRVKVDLGSGRAEVAFAEGARPSDQELSKAVEAAGLTLTRIERP